MSKVKEELMQFMEDYDRRTAEGEHLARLACDHCGVTWAELTAKTKIIKTRRGLPNLGGNVVKTRRIVRVRRIAVQLLRGAEPRYSFPEIARILGLKHHTGPMYAFRDAGKVPLTVEDLRNERGAV